jgi:hypothetical protein
LNPCWTFTMRSNEARLSVITLKLQYLAAQAIVNKHIAETKASPPDLRGPLLDPPRPDLDTPPPHWNTWGDAGLLTRPHIYAPYTKRNQGD